jgi:hypothetical protein
MTIPANPDALLTRDATAAALTEAGFPTAAPTLATKASRGGGPMYRKWSTRPLYRWGDALAWAQGRLGPTVQSTSEAESIRDRSSWAEATTPSPAKNPAPIAPAIEVHRAGGGTPLSGEAGELSQTRQNTQKNSGKKSRLASGDMPGERE